MPRPPDAFGRTALLPLAAAVALVVLCSLAIDRYGSVDEIGLINPAYTLATTGRMAYPAHYYFHEMVVHPPTHYAAVGLLLRAGVPLYYAEALPTVAWYFVLIAVVVRSPLQVETRIALLFGSIAPVLLFHNSVLKLELFGMRPEGELNAAWLTALVLLETARRRGWSSGWLIAGAAALTYAAALHYYAAPAWLAAPMYAVIAAREAAGSLKRVAAALAAGTAVVAIPMLAMFVVPHWRAITWMVGSLAGGSSLTAPATEHLAQYAYWRSAFDIDSLRVISWVTGVMPMLLARVPLVLGGLLLLLARRDTRFLALSGAPLTVALFAVATHKHAYYLVHELSLLAVGTWSLVLLAVATAARQLHWPVAETSRRAVSYALAAITLAAPPRSGDVRAGTELRVHEAEVARAAGIEVSGSDAVIGGRTGAWFISGARHWMGLELDSVWTSDPGVLSRVDAVVETYHMSNTRVASNGPNLASLYASGALRLRGFYIAGHANASMSYVVLTARAPRAVRGFATAHGLLFEIASSERGPYRITTLRCPASAPEALRKSVIFSQRLLLPSAAGRVNSVVTAVRRPEPVPGGCTVLSDMPAVVTPADRGALLEASRRRDGVMRFYQDPRALPVRQTPAAR